MIIEHTGEQKVEGVQRKKERNLNKQEPFQALMVFTNTISFCTECMMVKG